jgi:type IV secretion system protein VirB2
MKHTQRVSSILFAALLLVAVPAFAGVGKVNSTMQQIQAILIGVAVTVFTIAIIWAGFKMAFQHSKWSEVSNIVIGGILVGGSSAIAAWLVTP